MGRRKSFVELADDKPMEVTDASAAPPTKVQVSRCARRPDNPRPDGQSVSELASSIREIGQIQPAAIAPRDAYLAHRPAHADAVGDADYVVLAGCRRHLACLEAGESDFLVHVITGDRVADIIEIGIIENIQREPLLPVREAHELQQLKERHGTTRAVAEKIGKTHVYVSQRLALLGLVPQLQAAVDDRQLKIADARDLAKVPAAQQMKVYEAGPPYSYAAAPKPTVASGATPGQPDTYTRTEIRTGESPNGEAHSSPAVPRLPEEAEAGVGNAVSNPDFSAAESQASRRQPQPTADVGNAVSNHGLLPAPGVLVELMHRDYTAEQREHIRQLLQN